MDRNKLQVISLQFFFLFFLFVSCSKHESTSLKDSSEEQPVVGMVIDGPVLDGSFNEGAWKGLQKADKEGLAHISYRETKGPSEYLSAFEAYAQKEASLIFGVGFRLEEATYHAACENPCVRYVSIDGIKNYEEPTPNFFVASFSVEQAAFLAGYIAAKTSTTGKIGFLGGVESRIIDLFDYGFEAGAYYAKPEIQLFKQYTHSFTDVAKGRSMGEFMLNQGVDIIFHAAAACGNGMIEAVREWRLANKEGSYPVWAIGVDEDQYSLAPEIILTSVVKRVDLVVHDLIKNLIEDTFPRENILLYGLKDNFVGLSDSSKIHLSSEILNQVQLVKNKIENKEIIVPRNAEELKRFFM